MLSILSFFLCPDEATEDLLSLMTLLDHWVLDINSPDYSLGDVEGWIGRRAGCKKTGASRHYVSSGPSAPVLLHWHQITAFQGQLSIHARCITLTLQTKQKTVYLALCL